MNDMIGVKTVCIFTFSMARNPHKMVSKLQTKYQDVLDM